MVFALPRAEVQSVSATSLNYQVIEHHTQVATVGGPWTITALSNETSFYQASGFVQFLIGGSAGIWLGGILAKRLKGPTLQKTFSVAVVLVAGFVIWKSVAL
jgi:uncharacterized membrane protein YfcA